MSVDSKSDPFTLSISGVKNLIESGINKTKGGLSDSGEGVQGERIDVLELDMSEQELIQLARKREILYSSYETKIKRRQEANKSFYRN